MTTRRMAAVASTSGISVGGGGGGGGGESFGRENMIFAASGDCGFALICTIGDSGSSTGKVLCTGDSGAPEKYTGKDRVIRGSRCHSCGRPDSQFEKEGLVSSTRGK